MESLVKHKFRYLLSLGSNLGDRSRNIEKTLLRLGEFATLITCTKGKITKPMTSPAYDTSNHQDYLNCMLEISCGQDPEGLYSRIVEIEDEIGHSRSGKWKPRCIDIDILFFAKNDAISFTDCSQLSFLNQSGLQIPHYDFWHRDFLLTSCQNDLGLDISEMRKSQYTKWLSSYA